MFLIRASADVSSSPLTIGVRASAAGTPRLHRVPAEHVGSPGGRPSSRSGQQGAVEERAGAGGGSGSHLLLGSTRTKAELTGSARSPLHHLISSILFSALHFKTF